MKKNIILTIITILLLSACQKQEYKYQLSISQTSDLIKNTKLLPLDRLVEIIIAKDTGHYQFVDIRNPHQYANGHLNKAINLPFKSIDKSNLSFLCNKNKKFLIYGNNASDARLAYIFLKQLGINNILPVGGGYDFIHKNIIQNFAIHSALYDDEVPKYDYAKTISQTTGISTSNSNSSTPPPAPIMIKHRKTQANVGGCE
jgi:rhodanese-related sulfurtransferase